MGLVVIAGALNQAYDFWQGPSSLYFEFLLWPWYAVFGTGLLAALAGAVGGRFQWWPAAWVATSPRPGRSWKYAVVLIVLPLVLVLVIYQRGVPQQRIYPYPPPRTPLVELLANEVGLTPGSPFRGRVATVTGQNISGPVDWHQLHGLDFQLVQKFGNDHRLVGLWYHNIPTLAEYNQLQSPAFYSFGRAFLADPDDPQLRPIMVLRRIDGRILRMLGVRFVITDAAVAGAGALRLRLPQDGKPALFLYELEDANVGQYSPTTEVTAGTAREIVAALSKPDFDPRKAFVTDRPLNAQLVPTTASRLYAEKGGLRLAASADGTSVILLPLEYSNCLRLVPDRGSGGGARLFRANLLQTGVVFSGTIEAYIRYHTGPLMNQACRLEDARSIEKLDIRAADTRN